MHGYISVDNQWKDEKKAKPCWMFIWVGLGTTDFYYKVMFSPSYSMGPPQPGFEPKMPLLQAQCFYQLSHYPFFYQPSSVHGWTSAFLLAVHRLCGGLWGEIELFSATLAQDGLAECDQPGKNPLKYSAMAGNWTRATGKTDRELSHRAIMTDYPLHTVKDNSCVVLKLPSSSGNVR